MQLAQIYSSNEKVLSFEFFPPKQESSLPATLALMRELGALKPHFMTVTYGAGGTTQHFSFEMATFVQRELGLPVVFHLTCARHTKNEIDAVLDRLETAGITRVLALRGDRPQDDPNAVFPNPEGFRNARNLAQHIVQVRNIRPGAKQFSVAVAGYPEKHRDAKSFEADLVYLKEKVDAGAELVITQLFFDPDLYFQFVEQLTSIGVTVPIVPGVMPVANVQQIKRFTSMCGASIPKKLEARLSQAEHNPDEVTRIGIDYAVKQCDQLLEGGAPGIHFYTLNRSVQALPIVKELKRYFPGACS